MRGRSLIIPVLFVVMISCNKIDPVDIAASIGSGDGQADAARKEAADRAAQKRTVADIRNVGTAMFSWLTDQVGAAAAGQSQSDPGKPGKKVVIAEYPRISHAELAKILVPQYLQSLPEKDGWGHPYEFFLNVKHVTDPHVMGIRSAGRDGRFISGEYPNQGFDPDQFDEDIVWFDGYFVRWPQRPPAG